MKQLFFILLSILVTSGAIAQISPSNVYELKQYYKNNISTLDPIEGIYDAVGYRWTSNAYRDFPKERQDLGEIYIYKDRTGTFRWYGQDQISITKLNGNIYKNSVFWRGGNTYDISRFTLKNNGYFEVSESVPEQQLRYDLGRQYRSGDAVHLDISFVKTYPTDEMYIDAIKKKAQEQESSPSNWSGTGFAIAQGLS